MDYLIIRFLEEEITKEEALQLLNWIEASDENRQYFSSLHSAWAMIQVETTKENDATQIDLIIKKSVNPSTKKIHLLRMAVRIAAISLVLLGIAFLFISEEETTDYQAIMNSIPQGKEIMIMINPLQKTDHRGSQIITVNDSIAKLIHTNTGEVIINDTLNIEEAASCLNTIRIPYGKRSVLILEDSTTVYLNSGSTFIYPSAFSEEKREVYVDGEAYFDVKQNKLKPFIVKTAFKTIEVLGTTFNVSVSKEEDSFETVLVKGAIVLVNKDERIDLSPNQYYSYTPSTHKESIRNVDVRNYISWINGKLRFKQELVSSAIRKLEKVYNVKIKLEDESYASKIVSGELNLQDSVEETMTLLLSTLILNQEQNNKKPFEIFPNY